MDRPWREAPWPRAAAIAAIVAFPLSAFLDVAISRLTFPWDLEWLEGPAVDMGRRFAAGLPLYAAPSLDHIALTYFPLYNIVVGLLFKLVGVSYWPGRLVSLSATLGTGGLLVATVNHATKRRDLGWVAAGVWFAAYGHSGFFYDLNRTDALAAFFLMAAYAAAFWRPGPAAGALAGLFLAASAMTKQNHAAFLAPLIFAQLWRRDWRGAAALAIVFLATFGGAVAWLNHASDGWFSRLTMQMVMFAPIPKRAPLFAKPFVRCCAAASALIAAGVAIRISQRRWRDLLGDPWLGFWATGFALAFAFQLTGGGWINHNILVDLPTAAAACVALPEIAAWRRARWAFARRPAAAWLLPFVAALLVGSTWLPATGQVPPPEQWKAARQVREFIRRPPGPVLVVDFLPPEPNVIRINFMGYRDLHKLPSRFRWKQGWPERVEAELRAARPAAVLAHHTLQKEAGYAELTAGMDRQRLPKRLRVQAVTGKSTALALVWRPKPNANGEAAEQ